jgi:hypothetical protein
MSQGTPNLRVGLEVQIFGQDQLRSAQSALSQLGMTIEGVEEATVLLNGKQRKYYRGVVELTGANKKANEEQEKLAKTAIRNATAHGDVYVEIKRTTSAAIQAAKSIKDLSKEEKKAAESAKRIAEHTEKVTATSNAKIESDNNKARIKEAQDIRDSLENSKILREKTEAEQIRSDTRVAENKKKNNQDVEATRDKENERRTTKEQAHQRRMEAMERNHQLILERIRQGGGGGIFGGGGGILGNVGRVIAYDMLRRTITNLYQGAWRVAEALGQWTVESVQFNDELARAQTVFTGLGLIGTKNEQGGPMSIPQAEASSDPKVQEVLRKAQEGSDKMMRGLIEITALTGSDMDEVVSSARQLLPDLINKRSKLGMPNPYLQNPDELNMITQQMVKLASVLKMSDPGGRPLKWHMVALQELFSGTSGGAKDKGREAVRSLRAREGIKMTDEEAESLAKTVNSGDLVKASNIIESVLERSGQGIVNLSNLMAKTLKPNVDGTITALRLFGRDFTEVLHKDLIADFTTLRVSLFHLFKDPRYKAAMDELGKEFNNVFGDLRGTIFGFLQRIIDDPQILVTTLRPILENLRDGLIGVRLAFESLGLFLAGLFGSDLGMSSMITSMEVLRDNSYNTGVAFASLSRSLMQSISDMPLLTETFAGFGIALSILVTTVEVGLKTIIDLSSMILGYYIRFMNNSGPLNRLIGRTLGMDQWQGWAMEKTGDGPLSAFAGTIGAIDRLQQLLDLRNRMNNPAAAPTPPPPQPTPPGGGVPRVTGAVAPGANVAGLAYYGMIPTQGRPQQNIGIGQSSATQTIIPNINLNDNAVVEGFRAARPMRFEPRRVDQNVSVTIGTLNLTANDAQNVFDQLVALGRGRGATPIASGTIPADAAAQRGFID